MTASIFIVSLLAAMAIGMPIAYAVLVCGVALMAFHSDPSGLITFESQIQAWCFVSKSVATSAHSTGATASKRLNFGVFSNVSGQHGVYTVVRLAH